MTLKSEFFNFQLKRKLYQHSCAEFHGDSNGDGFKAEKGMLTPHLALIDLDDPKVGNI